MTRRRKVALVAGSFAAWVVDNRPSPPRLPFGPPVRFLQTGLIHAWYARAEHPRGG